MNDHEVKLSLIVILLFLLSGQLRTVLNFWGLVKSNSIEATIQVPTTTLGGGYISSNIMASIPIDYQSGTIFQSSFDGGNIGGGGSMKEKLSRYEGYKRCKYFDTKDIPSIGIGYNLKANQFITAKLIGTTWPNCINDGQINTLYNYSVKRAESELYQGLPWARNLPTGVREVMIRMSFNMGMGNSTRGVLSFQNTLRMLRQGDYRGAAEGFRNSAWCRDVRETRCREETAIIQRGR